MRSATQGGVSIFLQVALHRLVAVGRHDEALDHAKVHLPRALLAAHVNMLFQIARSQLGCLLARPVRKSCQDTLHSSLAHLEVGIVQIVFSF